MQNYNKESKDCPVGKKIVLEFLDFLSYKVRSDSLTMEEVESMARAIEENITLLGTADDFARFYDKPRTNISSTINRSMVEKPVRRVFYSFKAFRKIVPGKWKMSRVTPCVSKPEL